MKPSYRQALELVERALAHYADFERLRAETGGPWGGPDAQTALASWEETWRAARERLATLPKGAAGGPVLPVPDGLPEFDAARPRIQDCLRGVLLLLHARRPGLAKALLDATAPGNERAVWRYARFLHEERLRAGKC